MAPVVFCCFELIRVLVIFTITTSCKSASYYALKSYYLDIDNYSCSSAAGAATAAVVPRAADGAVERMKSATQALRSSSASKQRKSSAEWGKDRAVLMARR
jgi:hypothetical protein